MGAASGAYAAGGKKIYLSSSFLDTASTEQIVGVLIEEIGHFVDGVLNTEDAIGDEGAIFSASVQGKTISNDNLQALKVENDHSTITIDGQVLAIEQNAGTVAFSRANFQVGEDGKGFVPVSITRSNVNNESGSVTVSLTNGTATTAQDYITQTFTVDFDAGEITKAVNIPVINDAVIENSETINLTLINPTNFTLGTQSTATLTISIMIQFGQAMPI